MVTRSDLPFQLSFQQYNRVVEIDRFSTDPDLDVEDVPELKENQELLLHFRSRDEEAQFYMDGLEVLDERFGLEVDSHRMPFLLPQEEPWPLFKHTDEYYPLIPGFYRIKVISQGVAWHTAVRIVPKELTVPEWETMRDELEAQLRGLAQDLIRKNMGLGDPLLQFLPPEHLFRFLVINKHFRVMMAALSDLRTRVNHRIRKSYRIVPANRAKSTDQETVRHRLTHPEETGLKTPVREVDYDLLENRWVRHIVHVLSRYLDDITVSLQEYTAQIEREIEEFHVRFPARELTAYLRERQRIRKDLDAYVDKALSMLHGVQMIMTAEWYGEVAKKIPTSVSPVLLQDPRYRALYHLYRELKSESLEVSLDTSYAYQWKRTDLLYEMWGFLKIVHMLTQQLHYEPVSGWLFDHRADGNKIFIPSLPEGTCIQLQKDDVRLHLHYNAEIPNREDTDGARTPLYLLSSYHNRPDGRMDVFKDDVYLGSLILEFKYRPRYGRYPFWNVTPLSSAKRPVSTNQLIAYHGDSASTRFGGLKESRWSSRTRPVYETWALYPRRTGDTLADLNEYFEGYHVRLLVLTPGDDNAQVVDQLTQTLHQILDPTLETSDAP